MKRPVGRVIIAQAAGNSRLAPSADRVLPVLLRREELVGPERKTDPKCNHKQCGFSGHRKGLFACVEHYLIEKVAADDKHAVEGHLRVAAKEHRADGCGK